MTVLCKTKKINNILLLVKKDLLERLEQKLQEFHIVDSHKKFKKI